MGNSFDEEPLNRATQAAVPHTIREQPSFDVEKEDHLSACSPTHEFDPCKIAKPCSPFYQWKHDSPRPSMEQSHLKVADPSIHVSIHDLEAGSLTPTATQEKKKHSDNGILRLRPSGKQCMTKPKEGLRDRLRKLPRWQRLSTKILVALLIVGAIVGIGVGISIKVHGGVYKSANQQANIAR